MAAKHPARALTAVWWSRAEVLILTSVWLTTNLTGAQAQTVVGSGGSMEVVGKPNHNTGGGMFGTVPAAGGGFGGFGGFNGMATVRLESKIAPNTPRQNLLPAAPSLGEPKPPWLVTELAHVPEVFLQKPLEIKFLSPKDIENKTPAEREALTKNSNEALAKARAQIAQTLAQINYLNQKENDLFLTMIIESRGDLAGLPFFKGNACRMSKEVSRQFVKEVFPAANQFGGLGGMSPNVFGSPTGFGGQLGGFGGGGGFTQVSPNNVLPKPTPEQPGEDEVQARVAAWMQTSPENSSKRAEIVKMLASIKHPTATGALGKLAVFAPEKFVRDESLAMLKGRPPQDYTAALLAGLRYPWPEIAKNAMHAMVTLQRDDLIDDLVDFLDEPDPSAPFEQEKNGRKVTMVREVVRLNHHHNCITCHAPATSDPEFNKNGWTADFVAAHVTVPGQGTTTPSTGFGYSFGGTRFPDLAVRVDITYLRQDFSLMQKVENGMSGRPEERFDFLVRMRELAANETAAYELWREKQGPKYLSPNHQAALAVLRCFTNLEAEPTAAAWREALGMD